VHSNKCRNRVKASVSVRYVQPYRSLSLYAAGQDGPTPGQDGSRRDPSCPAHILQIQTKITTQQPIIAHGAVEYPTAVLLHFKELQRNHLYTINQQNK